MLFLAIYVKNCIILSIRVWNLLIIFADRKVKANIGQIVTVSR